jgi:carboxypeptidase family protein
MRRTIGTILLLGLGCGDNGVPNADPTGVIQGEVRDGTNGSPLMNVLITVVLDGKAVTATTDDTGWFALDRVPAGSTVSADFTFAGYATARRSVSIDDAAGEHPQSNSIANVLVDLFPNGNTLLVTVEDRDSGLPAENIQVSARNTYSCAGGGAPVAGDLLDVLQATTDANGAATLSGLATWQSYQITTTPSERYHSDSDCFTQGASSEPLALSVVPESCDGQPDYCCDWDDPCGDRNDGMCQCSGCAWEKEGTTPDCP